MWGLPPRPSATMKTQQELAERWRFQTEHKRSSCLCSGITRLTTSLSFRIRCTVLSLPMCLTTSCCDGVAAAVARDSILANHLTRSFWGCAVALSVTDSSDGNEEASHPGRPLANLPKSFALQSDTFMPVSTSPRCVAKIR